VEGGTCNWRGAGPDQHVPVFIRRHALGADEFAFEVRHILVVQLEAAFQGPIGHPATLLQQLADLVQHFIKSQSTFPL
jgi:hypothetical protein